MATTAQKTPLRPYGGISAEERVAGRRARFLDAGLELFGTRGYKASGVKALCAEAGLTERYFYESFRESRELFLAVFDGVTDELFQAVAVAVADAEPTPAAQLRAAIETFLTALAEDPRKPRIVFTEAAAAGPEALQHIRATLRRFSKLVAATARLHVPEDVSDELVDVFALSLVGTMDRLVAEWQDGELDMPIERVVDHCLTLFLALFTASSPQTDRS